MKRGEVYLIDFEPSIGGEIRKTRPAVIISNNQSNKYLNRIQVVPITSQITRLYPSEAYVTISGKQGKAMADQIMTISKQRIKKLLGKVSAQEIKDVERAIKVQLEI
ncbi:MAG TPA: type II toxin-antitoxin system PemK/MazF family toxin [Alphaproteobacteria bacterium]|nr:type II toxin-antitoxin system PemK/MazF family toxin [Alphaproteobacteria bacterium]